MFPQRKYNLFFVFCRINRCIFLIPKGTQYVINLIYLAQDKKGIGIGLCLLQYFTGWITLDEQGYFLTTLPVSIRWGWVLMLNAGTFVLIVALLSLPTMLISFILPERSIRFE